MIIFSHSVLFDSINDVLFAYGSNDDNECHPNINAKKITSPQLLTKHDIGTNSNHCIQDVIAGHHSSIVIVSSLTS